MNTAIKIIIVAFLGCLAVDCQQSTAFALIVNKSNRLGELSSSKVKLIFLRKISRWPWGAEILPVNLPEKHPARLALLSRILESTSEQMDFYWIEQKVSRGLSPPIAVTSVQDAKQMVAARAGGVAYIPTSDVDDTVRVIEIK